MKKYRKIIIISVCAVLLLGAFGLLHASVAAASLPAGGGNLSGAYTISDSTNLTAPITVESGKTLTITGSGTINWTPAADQSVIITNNGTLTIQGDSPSNRIVIDAKTVNDTVLSNLGTLVLRNVTIQNVGESNSKMAGFGGAIRNEAGGVNTNASTSLVLDNVIVNNCHAEAGAGLYVGNNHLADIDISDSQFNNCYAYSTTTYFGGGGICVRNICGSGLSDVLIENTTFDNCDSVQEGGAILVKRETAAATAENSTNTLAPTNLKLDGVTVQNCDAREGGGIHIDGKARVDLDVLNSRIYNCTTTQTETNLRNTYGGAGVNLNNSHVESNYNFENTVIEQCVSYWNGGGMRFCGQLPTSAVINLYGCTFKGNVAGNGSAILFHQAGEATANISKCIFTENAARYENLNTQAGDTDNYGGTLRAGWDGLWRAEVTDCLFTDNESTSAGGAVYWNQINGGSLLIQDCHCYRNKADNYGGGATYGGAMFFEALNTTINGTSMPTGETFTGGIEELKANGLVGTFIYDNYAQTGGGITYNSIGRVQDVEHGEIVLGENVLIQNNRATYGGGFAFRVKQSVVDEGTNIKEGATYDAIISGAVIKENTANYGGGIHLGKLMLGEYFTACDMTLNITKGEIVNNTATVDGGAVYIKGYEKVGAPTATDPGNTYFTMSNGTISGNVATTGNGGAIEIVDGSVTMSGGTVSNNTATSGSGGGFNVTGGSLTISGGTVSGNVAGVNGGGLNVSGGDIVIGDAGCRSELQNVHAHPVLRENVANGEGGGVAVSGGVSVSDGTITMYCGDVIYNTSNGDSRSNNVLVEGSGSFTIHNGYLGLGVKGNLTDTREGVDIIYHQNIGASSIEMILTKAQKPGYEFEPLSSDGNGFEANFFIREGYIFKGWSTSQRATTANFAAVADDGTVSGTLVAGHTDTTVYAVWEPISTKLTLTVSECVEDDHITVFNVESSSLTASGLAPVNVKIMVHGNDSISVVLPVGTYIVTVDKGWRYDNNSEGWSSFDMSADCTYELKMGEASNGKWLNLYVVA